MGGPCKAGKESSEIHVGVLREILSSNDAEAARARLITAGRDESDKVWLGKDEELLG